MEFIFYIQSLLLGIALATDSCCTMISNSLNEPNMKKNKIILISFTFAFFQAVMPLLGFLLGHVVLSYIENFIPWIALIILSFLGIKMIILSFKEDEEKKIFKLTITTILLQAIATSIDAFSIGFSLANLDYKKIIITIIFIFSITFILCIYSFKLGKIFNHKLGNIAFLLGGILLILIGLNIFLSNII